MEREWIIEEVASEDIRLDMRELSARLGGYCTSCSNIADKYVADILSAATPKYAARLCSVEYADGCVIIDGKKIRSEALIKNLGGAKRAYLLAVTLGAGVDRYLHRTSVISGAEHYIADGAASALADALCELANERICEGLDTSVRFSPGYADLPLSYQRTLLESLSAQKNLGITLTDSYLMIPTKSITAIIGIKNG